MDTSTSKWYSMHDTAKRLREDVDNSRNYDEKRQNIKRMNKFADTLRASYGYEDEDINWLISTYYLNWDS